MRAWERAKYEYSRRSKKDFLIWLYRSLKAKTLLIFHRLLSKSLGEKRYLLFLKKLRSRKLSNSEFIEIIEIDPEEIEYISPLREELKWFSTGKIKSGGWDKNLDQYEDLPFHKALKKRMNGVSWSDIDEVQKAREGGIKWPRKAGRVDKDISKTEDLIESIEKKGYLTQEELHETSYEEAEKKFELNVLNEVCVDLDRNGEPLFVDGRHRLSLAKILDVEKIPVRVVMRHKKLEQE